MVRYSLFVLWVFLKSRSMDIYRLGCGYVVWIYQQRSSFHITLDGFLTAGRGRNSAILRSLEPQ